MHIGFSVSYSFVRLCFVLAAGTHYIVTDMMISCVIDTGGHMW